MSTNEPKMSEEEVAQFQQDIYERPEQVREALRARGLARGWAAAHPEFRQSAENAKLVVDWLIEHKLEPSYANFDTALAALVVEEKISLVDTRPKLSAGQVALLKSVELMSSAEYKRRILDDPDFAKRVDEASAIRDAQTAAQGMPPLYVER
jgi:hypothetical protein